MSRVDDVVDRIWDDMDFSLRGGLGFRDDEPKNALDALAGLNSTEFKEAFDRLYSHSSLRDFDLRKQLAQDAGDLKNDPKYTDILRALEGGDPTAYVKAKKAAEIAAEEKKFEDYGFEKSTDGKKHAYKVDLYEPKGAHEALRLLIESVELTMQCNIDTLGCGKPKAAPDFIDELDSARVTTAEGWSELRSAHKKLKESLEKQQAEYHSTQKDVADTTYDSAATNSQTFKTLTKIIDELNGYLQDGPEDLTYDGDKFTQGSGGPPNSEVQITVYEKNKEQNTDGFGKYFLTPEAERRYYVRWIETAVEKWEKTYAQAVKEFQELAAKIDKKPKYQRANDSGTGNGGYPYPTPGPSTPPGDFQNEDFSSTYDDLLGGAASTSDLLTSAGLDGNGSGFPSSLGSAPSAFPAAALMGSGMPAASSPPAGAGDSGANALGQMAMMNALSGMMNQGNQLPSDERAYERDRERREEGERQRRAAAATVEPGTTANPAAPPTPPGVTSPANASTPPPVTTPGSMVDYRIGDSTVQVSQPVAEALQRQTQNTAMNAASAYAGTAGESIPERHPWETVEHEDFALLRTGDVVQWEKHSALIVKNENGLNVLDNGLLVPFDADNPPLTEKYGHFTDYFHPTGLDAGPDTVGPQAVAPPPPTVSAAPPAGPPPVGPPRQV
ncbi:hypothetical protein ACWEKR_24785 [Nocardia sp. NPDC004573]